MKSTSGVPASDGGKKTVTGGRGFISSTPGAREADDADVGDSMVVEEGQGALVASVAMPSCFYAVGNTKGVPNKSKQREGGHGVT